MQRRSFLVLAPAALIVGSRCTFAAAAEELVAINVLIEPDAALAARARALNARLRQPGQPRTFALDESHVPHVTLVQQYLRRAELPSLGAVLQDVLESNPMPSQLRLTGVSVAPWNGASMVSLEVERTAMLSRLQEALLAALIPFVAPKGDATAFVRDAPDSSIDAATLDYVSAFPARQVGENYRPHITVGLAPKAVAQALRIEPFEPQAYAAAGVRIYQLGNDGTARRLLWP
jgi:hypothetical protein